MSHTQRLLLFLVVFASVLIGIVIGKAVEAEEQRLMNSMTKTADTSVPAEYERSMGITPPADSSHAAVFERTWSEQPTEAQDTICYNFIFHREEVIKAWVDHLAADTTGLTPEMMDSFLTQKCLLDG